MSIHPKYQYWKQDGQWARQQADKHFYEYLPTKNGDHYTCPETNFWGRSWVAHLFGELALQRLKVHYDLTHTRRGYYFTWDSCRSRPDSPLKRLAYSCHQTINAYRDDIIDKALTEVNPTLNIALREQRTEKIARCTLGELTQKVSYLPAIAGHVLMYESIDHGSTGLWVNPTTADYDITVSRYVIEFPNKDYPFDLRAAYANGLSNYFSFASDVLQVDSIVAY